MIHMIAGHLPYVTKIVSRVLDPLSPLLVLPFACSPMTMVKVTDIDIGGTRTVDCCSFRLACIRGSAAGKSLDFSVGPIKHYDADDSLTVLG